MTDEPTEPQELSRELRGVACWLTIAFVLLTVALGTWLALSDLERIDGSHARWASLGMAVALASTILVALAASTVLTGGRIGASDLTGSDPRRKDVVRELERSPWLYSPHDGVDALLSAPSGEPGRSGEQVERLLEAARYEDMRLRFARARTAMLAFVALAAAGVGLFAYETRLPAARTPPAIAEGPVQAIVDLDDHAKQQLRSTLGDRCDLDKLYVFVLGQDEQGFDIISLPSERCEMTRIKIANEDGRVRPEDPLSLKDYW